MNGKTPFRVRPEKKNSMQKVICHFWVSGTAEQTQTEFILRHRTIPFVCLFASLPTKQKAVSATGDEQETNGKDGGAEITPPYYFVIADLKQRPSLTRVCSSYLKALQDNIDGEKGRTSSIVRAFSSSAYSSGIIQLCERVQGLEKTRYKRLGFRRHRTGKQNSDRQ